MNECWQHFLTITTLPINYKELEAPPTCWTVIEPQLTETSTVQVLVATQSGAILSVDTEQAQDMLVPNGPFLSMAVAPTGKILACFTKSGNVWIVSTDFAQNLSTFETKSPVPPTQMVWCGFGAVCCYWGSDEGHLLFVVGPHASYYRYNYADPICLIPEPDGVRIISARKCEFVQRVSSYVLPTSITFSLKSEQHYRKCYIKTRRSPHFVSIHNSHADCFIQTQRRPYSNQTAQTPRLYWKRPTRSSKKIVRRATSLFVTLAKILLLLLIT